MMIIHAPLNEQMRSNQYRSIPISDEKQSDLSQ